MFKIGDILTKENYTDAANWCNAHPEERATIDKNTNGEYEIVAIPEPTTEEIAKNKRAQRDALLVATDKYMVIDFPISDEKRAQYKVYRQYLRDIPSSDLFPNVDILTFEEWSK